MKILVAGDFVPYNRVIKSISDKDFSFFDEIREINKTIDYSIVNLEAPIVIDQKARPIKKSGPNLRCTKGAMEAIKYAGFDCVTLANNHLYDYGNEGYLDTINTCNEYGIDYVGVGDNLEDAKKILYKKIKDKIIAIINFCENEWSIATETTSGANPLSIVQNHYQIKEARNNADYVIVIVHGGKERYQLPTPRMKETYRFFIDSGADVIINHHQHCYSGYETYNGKPIVYGIGNFCFDASSDKPTAMWKEGYVVVIELENIISFKIIPYEQCGKNLCVRIIDERESFDKKINEINNIIQNDSLLNKSFKEKSMELSESYIMLLEPYAGNKYFNYLYKKKLLPSFVKRNKRIIMNLIRCESHRDFLLEMLNRK